MIKVVTDSTSGLPPELVLRHDIRVVPLRIHFGQTTYKEGIDLSSKQFYHLLAEAQELPTTSQPPPADFAQVFEELTADGHDIVVMTISNKLSGTYLAACQARERFPNARITVVDSFTTSLALEMAVVETACVCEEGKSYEEAVTLARKFCDGSRIFFLVDTLDYLQKGGRIGRATAFIGTLLNVKPILFVEDGMVSALERVRTRNKGLKRLFGLVEQHFGGETPLAVGVAHAGLTEEAHQVEEMLRSRFSSSKTYSVEISPVIGTHTGPGAIGLAALAPPSPK